MTCARCGSTSAIGVRYPRGVAELEPCPDCAGTGSYGRTSAPWLEEWEAAPEEEWVTWGRVGERRARLAAAAPALVRALLVVEWAGQGRAGCAECGECRIDPHDRECPVDIALTAAGLATQVERDKARREIAQGEGR